MPRDHSNDSYVAALHAMQSGVAADIGIGDGNAINPKHLRVGINSALCNDAALARLLIAKGLFTWDEYLEEIRKEMCREVERYEKDLSTKTGKEVTLG